MSNPRPKLTPNRDFLTPALFALALVPAAVGAQEFEDVQPTGGNLVLRQ